MADPTTPDAASVQTALQDAFPGAAQKVTITTATDIIDAVNAGTQPVPAGGAAGFRYYMAQATHSRTIGTNSSFVGNLPLVRVPLPQSGNFDTNLVPVIQTGIGALIPEDRLIASVDMVSELFGHAQPVARVDLLTPARAPGVKGARFGAFATYLCYANAADLFPSWYILEGGTAPGVPRVLYASQGMDWIVNKQLGYQPTTFSKVTDWVSGLLVMHGNEPYSLEIRVSDTSGKGPDADPSKPYVQVYIQYIPLPGPSDNNPFGLIIEAAARLSVIGDAIGMDAGITEDIAAFFGAETLNWITKPGS